MKRIVLVALLALAALIAVFALRGGGFTAPCTALAAEICENGREADCVAFVDGEMVARHEEITDEHKQIACRTVLDDPPTVGALQAAFEARQSTGGGSAKKGSASK